MKKHTAFLAASLLSAVASQAQVEAPTLAESVSPETVTICVPNTLTERRDDGSVFFDLENLCDAKPINNQLMGMNEFGPDSRALLQKDFVSTDGCFVEGYTLPSRPSPLTTHTPRLEFQTALTLTAADALRMEIPNCKLDWHSVSISIGL